ncbi:MAG: hypothetical protein CL898_02235 [Dehalococcoidia bacterium]|nr:hypothetical protein [Dehalococcoidia bacterium]
MSDGSLGGSSNGYFKVGNDLTQYYTKSNTQSGYFYRGSSGYPSPSVSFGFVDADPPSCPWKNDGYTGFTNISMAGNLAGVPYSDTTVSWDTREGASCYFGLLPFKQGNRYGLLDPLSIDASGNLTLNWWVGDEGVTNFSNAPSLVTPSPTPTPSPTSTPTPIPTATPTPNTSTWNGTYGTTVMHESDSYDIGTGSRMWWSIAGGKRGYFYSSQGVTIANVNPTGKGCNGTHSADGSYDGVESRSELSNVSTFQYSTGTNVGICSEDAAAYYGSNARNDGALVFKQNDRYGVMRFVSISNGNMTIKWWLGAPGVTDFSDSPSQ